MYISTDNQHLAMNLQRGGFTYVYAMYSNLALSAVKLKVKGQLETNINVLGQIDQSQSKIRAKKPRYKINAVYKNKKIWSIF